MCSCFAAQASDLPAGFVRIADITDLVHEDIRYASANNFTGQVVPGYLAGQCWLRRETAEALKAAAEHFKADGFQLIAYDCYRPKRAVAAFVAWSKDETDQLRKADFYPDIAKPDLIGPFIGPRSSHSKGIAVDVGLRKLDGTALDFGTPFDFFGPQSRTAYRHSPEVRHNRQRLKRGMEAQGFRNYPGEWWHFGLELPGAEAHDAPIR